MSKALKKIGILSNVNMSPVFRNMQGELELCPAEGYGNELGILMNPSSGYNTFGPDITFLIIDLMELAEHDLEQTSVKAHVKEWFDTFALALKESCLYYINDAYLWGVELGVTALLTDTGAIEQIWNDALREFVSLHDNVRVFPYHKMISTLGEENAFSMKMWYMGKILLSGEAYKRLAAIMAEKVELENRVPKKVLALDLDNTLWGGLAGENDHTPVVLSEDHTGLAYKNLQRVILQMQRQGVILAIVSKNNLQDAEDVLQNHPHMVLTPECFAAKKINWNPKNQNLQELAEELNLGLDSFVFFDDNPEERFLITETIPEVTVPDFPDKSEDLAPAMAEIYHRYFEKTVLTKEDLEKTESYAANAKRASLRQSASNFYDYLKQLKIVVTRVEAKDHLPRMEALVQKTNQFNLTTRRHDRREILELTRNSGKAVYLYQVKDRFGDNGVVALAIVDLTSEIPVIEEFLMSCRVMGKNVEQGILKDIELDMMDRGYNRLRGLFCPTAKNHPVEAFYPNAGYELAREDESGMRIYEIELAKAPIREFMGLLTIENIKEKEV